MRFVTIVTIVALLAGTLPALAHAQGLGNPRFHVDVSGGLAMSKSYTDDTSMGPDFLIGVNFPLSPLVDWRLQADATLFLHNPGELLFQSSSLSTLEVDPLLSLFTGVRVALSPASTHMYLHGSVGVFAPSEEGPTAGGVGIGVGIRNPRVFGEIAYTHAFEAHDNGGQVDGFGYASFPFGVSLGSR